MEDLNKNQLILLTLLISFVTSIGTGIITVSLLQEAPPNITQTINRVVEKTIETVVSDSGSAQKTKEVTTVVVKEEDLVIDAIEKNSKSVVRIKDNAIADGVNQFYGIGFLVNKDGTIVSARRDTFNQGSTYTATFSDGTSFSLRPNGVNVTNEIVFFSMIKDPNVSLPSEPVKFTNSEPKLGQTVIVIEGLDKNIISIGRISSYIYPNPDLPAEGQVPTHFTTDIISKSTTVGGPAVNLAGEVVGIRIPTAEGSSANFVSPSILKEAVTQHFAE